VKVFLSWSGEKSRGVAEALRDWLPSVVQQVEPFMSDQDIDAGARWQQRISEELEGARFGILCVTRENQEAPWLNFEAGAIAKEVDTSRVVPLAIDLTPADVVPPLGLFQAKPLSRNGLLGIVESINAQCERPLANITEACDVWWPKLEPALAEAQQATESRPVRSQRDLIEEILTTVRGLTAGLQPSPGNEIVDAVIRLKEQNIAIKHFEDAAAAREVERSLKLGTMSAQEALPRLVWLMSRFGA
jgi:hypothetical protein